jgi:tRNA uracil 4-sulfurtransferase
MIYNSILIRYTGEFGVKSIQSQEYIEDLLHSNIRRALNTKSGRDLLGRITFVFRQGRLYINFEKEQDADVSLLISVVGRIFGISSISPCFRTSLRDKTAVVSVAAKLMVAHDIGPGSSKISVRAIKNPNLDIPSLRKDITILGKKIAQKDDSDKGFSRRRFKKGPRWKTTPWNGPIERMLEIEVYEDQAYISVERIKSPGGFPLGLEDQLVALVSGGLDSPVAAWLAMRRGVIPIFVVMDPHADKKGDRTKASNVIEKALKNIQILVEYTKGAVDAPTVYVVPYGSVLDVFIELGSRRGITCLLCKRFMYRVAEHIAFIHNAQGIVTGEILGEQASQTAKNLSVLDSAVMMPVHRPLFGFDKDEVVALTSRIGTRPIADIASDPCRGVPNHPAIRGDLIKIEKVEEKMDIKKYLETCLIDMERVKINKPGVGEFF